MYACVYARARVYACMAYVRTLRRFRYSHCTSGGAIKGGTTVRNVDIPPSRTSTMSKVSMENVKKNSLFVPYRPTDKSVMPPLGAMENTRNGLLILEFYRSFGSVGLKQSGRRINLTMQCDAFVTSRIRLYNI